MQTFNVNNLNELTTATRSGTLTVAGTTTSAATTVTVNGSGAYLYADNTFAKDGFTVTNGTNTFTAIAQDSYNRKDTNAVSVDLPATVTFVYDLNGNLTSDGKRRFDFDDENQLSRVTVTNEFKKEFVYDGLNRLRIKREYKWSGAWIQTNEVRFIYDGNLVVQHRDANNLPTLSLTRGNDLSGSLQGAGGIGGLLALSQLSTVKPQHYYYHSDGNGNITALVNTNQIIVARHVYDSFGITLSLSGTKADANPYWFSSQLYDADTDFCHYQRRVYVPIWQRWLNRDPSEEEGGINLLGFAYNDPINAIDDTGMGVIYMKFKDGRTLLQITPDADPNRMRREVIQEFRKEGGDEAGRFLIGMAVPGPQEIVIGKAIGKLAKPAAKLCEPVIKEIKLLKTARGNLLSTADNPRLRDAINNLYRLGAKLGNGSSMDAIRIEGSHVEKVLGRRTQLMRILDRENLNAADKQIVKDVLRRR